MLSVFHQIDILKAPRQMEIDDFCSSVFDDLDKDPTLSADVHQIQHYKEKDTMFRHEFLIAHLTHNGKPCLVRMERSTRPEVRRSRSITKFVKDPIKTVAWDTVHVASNLNTLTVAKKRGDVMLVETLPFTTPLPIRELCLILSFFPHISPQYRAVGEHCYWFCKVVMQTARTAVEGATSVPEKGFEKKGRLGILPVKAVAAAAAVTDMAQKVGASKSFSIAKDIITKKDTTEIMSAARGMVDKAAATKEDFTKAYAVACTLGKGIEEEELPTILLDEEAVPHLIGMLSLPSNHLRGRIIMALTRIAELPAPAPAAPVPTTSEDGTPSEQQAAQDEPPKPPLTQVATIPNIKVLVNILPTATPTLQLSTFSLLEQCITPELARSLQTPDVNILVPALSAPLSTAKDDEKDIELCGKMIGMLEVVTLADAGTNAIAALIAGLRSSVVRLQVMAFDAIKRSLDRDEGLSSPHLVPPISHLLPSSPSTSDDTTTITASHLHSPHTEENLTRFVNALTLIIQQTEPRADILSETNLWGLLYFSFSNPELQTALIERFVAVSSTHVDKKLYDTGCLPLLEKVMIENGEKDGNGENLHAMQAYLQVLNQTPSAPSYTTSLITFLITLLTTHTLNPPSQDLPLYNLIFPLLSRLVILSKTFSLEFCSRQGAMLLSGAVRYKRVEVAGVVAKMSRWTECRGALVDAVLIPDNSSDGEGEIDEKKVAMHLARRGRVARRSTADSGISVPGLSPPTTPSAASAGFAISPLPVSPE